ncbi:hypothetical protein WG899_08370 [Paucibacter sp. AS339]|uniref:hypothetical protein n=1 Tax=Paucibacter hankyongi TaxID=3133434 RepID=UPI0030A8AF04
MSRPLLHTPLCRFSTLLLTLLASAAVQAADSAAETSAEKTAKTELVAAGVPDAQVKESVIEDDSTRIEELRVRGHTQKVTVQPKNSKLPSYEIIMGDGSRDLSPGAGTTRGAAGRRVWSVLNF